jgi:hypothetical protein
VSEIAEPLERAFRRLNDFATVQSGTDHDDLLAAVERLMESVGIADDSRVVLCERIAAIQGVRDADVGQITFGVIAGLMAAQLERE